MSWRDLKKPCLTSFALGCRGAKSHNGARLFVPNPACIPPHQTAASLSCTDTTSFCKLPERWEAPITCGRERKISSYVSLPPAATSAGVRCFRHSLVTSEGKHTGRSHEQEGRDRVCRRCWANHQKREEKHGTVPPSQPQEEPALPTP